MTLPGDFIASLRPMHPREVFEMITKNAWPKGGAMFELVNELRPLDLFCYLGARFGQPNGFQNFLRKDDSDNLIHWEWTLRHKAGIVSFQGMNFRTEVHTYGDVGAAESDKDALVAQVKADFAAHGSVMSDVRKKLEHWVEFVNPYQRIKMSIDGLIEELAALKLEPDQDALDVFQWETDDPAAMEKRAEERGARYSKGFGLCFGIRSMLPILAEAYIIDMCISNRHSDHKKAGRSEAVIKERRSAGRVRAFLVIRHSAAMSSSRASGRPLARVALKWVQPNSSGFRSGA